MSMNFDRMEKSQRFIPIAILISLPEKVGIEKGYYHCYTVKAC